MGFLKALVGAGSKVAERVAGGVAGAGGAAKEAAGKGVVGGALGPIAGRLLAKRMGNKSMPGKPAEAPEDVAANAEEPRGPMKMAQRMLEQRKMRRAPARGRAR